MTHIDYDRYYQQALQKNSWYDLTPYPYLLFRWQYKHPKDVLPIAKLAAHRLGKHTWCKTPEECQKVERFIQEHTWEEVQMKTGDFSESPPPPTQIE